MDWQRACEEGRIRQRPAISGKPRSRHTRDTRSDLTAPVEFHKIVRAGERYFHVQPAICEPDVNVDIRIVYEDEALIVIHKPAPLPMHPSGRFNRNTLQHFLSEVYQPQNPRPAHRLDANTTGLVLFTRSRHFAKRLQQQFEQTGSIEKRYLARVHGHPVADTFTCTLPISEDAGPLGSRAIDAEHGLSAETSFRVLTRFADGTALLEVVPHTGRTNQIRVHLGALNHPICGDATYLAGRAIGESQTKTIDARPLCLLAQRIAFYHPLTRERLTFETEWPVWSHEGGINDLA
jgi:UPF0176 protein